LRVIVRILEERKERERGEKKERKEKMRERESEDRGKGRLLGRPLFLVAIFNYFCNCRGFRRTYMGESMILANIHEVNRHNSAGSQRMIKAKWPHFIICRRMLSSGSHNNYPDWP
jgi:hypothetical protein